jgi:tetrahydromethanopterin S-methyltransferase subunit F
MGGKDAAAAGLGEAAAAQPGPGTALCGEDDGTEPGASDAADRVVHPGGAVQPKNYRRQFAVRRQQLQVPGPLAVAGTIALGIAELFAAVLIIVPRFQALAGEMRSLPPECPRTKP